TAAYAGEKDPTGYRGHDSSFNWTVQGADAGLYENSDVHAIRILLLEPTSETRAKGGRRYYNHARERMRILGQVPVRKFDSDVKPILERSCVACHTKKADKPAGNLVLDDDTLVKAENPAGLGFTFDAPATYARLAADRAGKWGHKPLHRHGHRELAASRYVKL